MLAAAGLDIVGWAAAARAATPGSPGAPQAATTVYAEDFENGPATTPIALQSYHGGATALNETYTASSAWTGGKNCDGWATSAASTAPSDPCLSASAPMVGTALAGAGDLTTALGELQGESASQAASNHALVEYTGGPDFAAGTEVQTSPNNVPAVPGHFYAIRADLAVVDYAGGGAGCDLNDPSLRFALLDGATVHTLAEGIDPCTTPASHDIAVNGANMRVSRFVSPAFLWTGGSTMGLQVADTTDGSDGNDHALDNLKVIDVTPQADAEFSPAAGSVGAVSSLTFTITNTDELDAKSGWSFTEALPSPLKVADNLSTTTCPHATVTANPGPGSISAAGDLDQGMGFCTVTVHVTSPKAASYTLAASAFSASGLNPPADASVAFGPAEVSLTVKLNHGRFRSGDQFTVGLDGADGNAPPTNPGAAHTSAGASSAVKPGTGTTGATAVDAGAMYFLTEDGAAGGDLVDYTSTITCADANGLQPGLPSAAPFTGSQPITPVAGAAISCVVTNTAKSPPANVTVTDVQGNSPAQRGDTLTYKITVVNSDSSPVSSAFVDDIIPAYTAYVPGSTVSTDASGTTVPLPDATVFVNGGIHVPVGDLAPGAKATVSFQVTVAPTAGGGSLVTDGATARWIPDSSVTPVTSQLAVATTTVATRSGEPPLTLRGAVGVLTPADFAKLCPHRVQHAPAVLNFKLFDDADIIAGTTLIEYAPSGDVISWRGHIAGSVGGVATATITNACTPGATPLVSGAFYAGGKMYSIMPSTSGQIIAAELNGAVTEGAPMPPRPPSTPMTNATPHNSRAEAPPPGLRTPAAQASAATTTAVIDVLALYTPKARDVSGGDANAISQIQSSEGLVNAALGNSGVNARVHIIGIQRADGYTGPDDNTGIAAFQTGSDGANGPALRDRTGADIVTLFVAGGTGIGYMPLPPTSQSDNQGFSQANIQYVPYETASHEWGHNLGANHDLADSTPDTLSPSYPYNHGYTPPSNSWRTIMAYPAVCNNCPVIPYYSNPRNTYQGEAMGATNAADNVQMLNQGAPAVAAYRVTQNPVNLYSLTVNSSPVNQGTATANVASPYLPGTVVTVTEWPASGFKFSGWILDGQPYDGTNQSLSIQMNADHTITASFVSVTSPTPGSPSGPPSLSGTGMADVVSRGTDGYLRDWHNNGFDSAKFTVNWGSGTIIGSGWANTSAAAMYYADLRGTGRKDLIVKGGDGSLTAYYNQGYDVTTNTITWSGGTRIGSGWGGISPTDVFFADLSGSGRADIARRGTDGKLYRYPNNGVDSNGVVNWGSTVTIGSGWGSTIGSDVFFAEISGFGRADLVRRGTDGNLYRYPNNGVDSNGVVNWGSTVTIGSGWGSTPGSALHFADLSGSGYADLVAKGSDGKLREYHNQGLNPNGTIVFTGAVTIGSGWSNVANTDFMLS